MKKVTLHGWNGSSGYDPHDLHPYRIHLEYKQRGDKPPIQGTLSLGGNKREMEWYRVYNHDHTVLEGTTNWSNPELTFREFLISVQETFAINKSPETRKDILDKLRVVIAAYKSANEGNIPVSVDEVGDYSLPTIRIEAWDKIPD